MRIRWWFDVIPRTLWLFLALGAYGTLLGFTFGVFNYEIESVTNAVAYYAMLFFPAGAILLAVTLMSITARVRAGGWWRNNVITYALRLTWRIAAHAWRILCRILRGVWRLVCRVCRRIFGFLSEIGAVPLTVLFALSVILPLA